MFKKFLSKYRKRKKWKQLNNFLPFLVIFGVLLILESSYFLARNELSHRLPFGVKIANTEFGLIEAEAAKAELEILVQKFSQQPLRFEFEDEVLEILPAEVDLNFAIERKIGVLKNQLVNFEAVEIPTSLNEKRLRKLLLVKFPELEYSPTDAKVFLGKDGELKILAEKNGHQTDFGKIATGLKKIVGSFSSEILKIENVEIPPKILAKQLEPFREELRKIIAEKLILKKTEYERFEIDLAQRIAWFDFKENGELKLFLKADEIDKFVEKELNLLVGELPHDTAITQNLEGEIEFEGVAKNGKTVVSEKLFERISAALESGKREIEIPFRILPAPVKVTDELRDLGIVELVGEAITNYDGSPANRQHNIRVAAKRLNGKLIPDGEKFSFLNNLGLVTERNGYRRELVIKEGDIVPEIGGGVCQVSTTFFRTALNAGLPITRQKPHSMKVSYYNPPGLDATVYPGSVDLEFLNDTGHPLLIQTAVEGAQLRVNFFGTSDGRSVKMAGPFYPNGNPVTNLSRAGMRMFWLREILAVDSEKIEERYDAAYRLMPVH